MELSPAGLAPRLLTPGLIRIGAGTVLDYRVRWLGLPLGLRVFVREWDPPVRFLAVQLRGPYARWEHRHLLLEEAGGTRVEDRLVYRLPLGPLGRLAHALLVRRQLERIWRRRALVLAGRFGAVPSGRR